MPIPMLLSLIALISYVIGCKSEIYCNDEFLETLQLSGIFQDSKTFVDMPTKRPTSLVLTEYERIIKKGPSMNEIKKFINDNFQFTGFDIVYQTIEEWNPEIKLLPKLSPQLRIFVSDIHSRWKRLYRKFDSSVLCNGCESSALDLPHPFIIPGGRFREFYYWDSYWISKGLLVSELVNTTKNVLLNLSFLINQYGYVPNGSRVYYLTRSQPPYFTKMVNQYFDHTKDFGFLEMIVSSVEIEYEFWMTERVTEIRVENGDLYKLNFYNAETDSPRPESYKEDVNLNPSSSRDLFSNILSATESGWDFSSRWMRDSRLSSLDTRNIIPVDLNALMYENELLISKFYTILGNPKKAAVFESRALSRKKHFNEVFWQYSTSSWKDYNRHNLQFYLSDLSPLWSGIEPPIETSKILKKHETLLTNFYGIPISSISTEQQWDFPNAWAPYQFELSNYLFNVSHLMSLKVAQNFLDTAWCGWNATGYFFEKYDVTESGKMGTGGEYKVQEGFGWTNGVLLSLINLFGNELSIPTACNSLEQNYSDVLQSVQRWNLILMASLVLTAFSIGCRLNHFLKPQFKSTVSRSS